MHDPSILNPDYLALSDQQLSEIDALGDRFDRELMDGKAPCIETFLAAAPDAAQNELLAELLAMEVEYRTRQSDHPQPDDYLQQLPQRESAIAAVFDSHALTRFPDNETISDNGDKVLESVDVPPELDNFHLIEVIGRGGMGVVWRADQIQPVKRRVALKLIKWDLRSREVIARFDAEKQALAMMDHQNIARVLDAGTTQDGRPYFVMELVEGIPITQYCDENKLSVDERLKLFVSVCNAVQHAHQKGIIHRDLKPSNVLVTVIESKAVPKVIDFGLAKAVQYDEPMTDVTMQTEFGKVIGTVQYMSPEQAELKEMDAQDVDTRTDVYSLGVMLYELLTGSTPLDKETLGQNAQWKILELIREHDPPRPSIRLSSSSHDVISAVGELQRLHPARLQQILKGELDWVVMRALEKDPTRRYQTAHDLAQDLDNYLTGGTVVARPPSTWYRVQKFARRNRGIVTAVFAIGVVLLAGIAGTGYGLVRATQKARLADETTFEAEKERGKAKASEQLALLEKEKAQSNERRAVKAENLAAGEARRARDSEASAKFQLAVAMYDNDRAVEARSLLHQISPEYRDNFEWHCCNRRFQGSDITCYGHVNEVFEVAFTPDGTRVVSAGKGGKIRLWDAAIGRELGSLQSPAVDVMGLAVSPDGTRIASAGNDKTVRLWDAVSGKVVQTLNGHAGAINGVAFSPSGDRIASTSDDHTIKIWDAKTGKEIITITGHKAAVLGVAFTPDGEKLASTSGDKTVRIWDSRSGEQITIVRQEREETRRVAFSPDGTRLATVSYGRFSLWDTHTWQLVAENIEAHERLVRCVAFSPDGTQFATGADDTTIKLWDTQSGNLTATLSGHAETVWSVAFSPDGTRLVSGSQDKTVKIWATHGGNELTLSGLKSALCATFSADGRQLASGGDDGMIILRDAQTSKVRFTLNGHVHGSVNKLSFSPDGTRLASAGDDGTVRLWDTHTGEEIAVLKAHSGWVRGVAYSPDGSQLASAGRDGTVKLWDSLTNEETATLKGHRGDVYCIDFSPDGSRLASGSLDRTVKLWDARSGKEINSFTGLTGLVRSVAFGPRGERLVAAGYGTKIRMWDVDSCKPIWTANRSSGAIFGIAFSPDGTRVATSGTDRAIQLYDALSGREIMTLPSGGSAIEFNNDGKLAVASGGGGVVRIWDAPQKPEIAILSGHVDTVTSVSFGSDGSRIYSESENEKLVWDFKTGEKIQGAMWEPPQVPTNNSLDSRWFVTAESNNVVLVDLEYKNTPDEKGYRMAKASFNLYWHQEQATKAVKAENWYAAVFHYARLLRHDPDSLANYTGLQSAYRSLTIQDLAEVESKSRLEDLTGNHSGTFWGIQDKRIITTLPESPFQSTKETKESPTEDSDSNHALYFDGASYADLGHLPFYKAKFTVEGWIKPMSTRGSLATVFTVGDGDKTAISAEVTRDGSLRFLMRNPPGVVGGLDISSETNVIDGEWHHFAVVRGDDDKLHLFIDGSLESSSEETAADFIDTPYRVFLGMHIKKNPRSYVGLMDDFRFWNYARTTAEIIRDSNRRIQPESMGLVSYYDFNPTHSTPGFEKNWTHTYLAPVLNEALKLHAAKSRRR